MRGSTLFLLPLQLLGVPLGNLLLPAAANPPSLLCLRGPAGVGQHGATVCSGGQHHGRGGRWVLGWGGQPLLPQARAAWRRSQGEPRCCMLAPTLTRAPAHPACLPFYATSTAGFMLAYQNSSGRLMGFNPNDAGVEGVGGWWVMSCACIGG